MSDEKIKSRRAFMKNLVQVTGVSIFTVPFLRTENMKRFWKFPIGVRCQVGGMCACKGSCFGLCTKKCNGNCSGTVK
ncbi:MAG: hypothetical protein Q4D98_04265 [Planctomycetia bacterium]|nr:hypothetical protein [Planctomycetia bacterium]